MRCKAIVRRRATQDLQEFFAGVAIRSLGQVGDILADLVLKLIQALKSRDLLLIDETERKSTAVYREIV